MKPPYEGFLLRAFSRAFSRAFERPLKGFSKASEIVFGLAFQKHVESFLKLNLKSLKSFQGPGCPARREATRTCEQGRLTRRDAVRRGTCLVIGLLKVFPFDCPEAGACRRAGN